MAVALDIAASLTLFQNALIYTIAASSVTSVIDTADTSSTLLLILTIALIVSAAHTVSASLPQPAAEYADGSWFCGVCRRKRARGQCTTCSFSARLQLRLGPLLEMVHFLVATVANVLMQFESTLVARMMISTLSPSAVAIEWVVLYVTIATSLLWLVKHAAT